MSIISVYYFYNIIIHHSYIIYLSSINNSYNYIIHYNFRMLYNKLPTNSVGYLKMLSQEQIFTVQTIIINFKHSRLSIKEIIINTL